LSEKKIVKAKKEALSQEVAPVAYDGKCLTIHGLDILVFSAAFHYFRCPKALWEDRFLKIRKAGFNAVETYIPWNWHEREEGKCDLTDLDDWLKMAAKHGFYTIVRPGPYICAEWEGGGHPAWLAGRGINWRTDSEACIKWSRHWYEKVMPVVAAHQITRGGRLIMVQVENEYEYAQTTDDIKRTYVSALYEAAREYGIDVPIFTCRTPVIWDRENPEMKKMFDTYTFYPWWNFGWMETNLADLRVKQPDAPLMIMELQGGWFTEIGGKFDRHTELDGKQVDALAKTVLGAGVTGLNYYMFFGGTHPGYWGMPSATTSYDYAAPLTEPGGLWEKWYSVKLLGDFIATFGPILAKSEALAGGHADAPGVSTFLRRNGEAVFAFLRNDTEEGKDVRFDFPTECHRPSIHTHLAPRQFKVFPTTVSIGRLVIERCSAQIQSIQRRGNRWIMLLADEPGTYDLAVRIQDGLIESKIHWDATGRVTQVHPRLVVWGQSPDQAKRTWAVETPSGPAMISTGAYLLRDDSSDEAGMTLTLETRPGETALRALLPAAKPAVKELRLQTKPLPAGIISPSTLEASAEDLRGGDGWTACDLKPLHELGWHKSGFIRYRSEFEWKGEKGIAVSTFAADNPVVSINGKPVGRLSGSEMLGSASLEGLVHDGKNTIEVLIENRGRTKFGEGMEESKGLKRVDLLPSWRPDRRLDDWKYSLEGEKAPEEGNPAASDGFDASFWKDIRLGATEMENLQDYNGWIWARTTLNLDEADVAAGSPLLHFEGVRGSLKVFVNGRNVGGRRHENEWYGDLKGLLKAGSNVIMFGVEKSGLFGGIWRPIGISFTGEGNQVGGWEFVPGLTRMPGSLGSGEWASASAGQPGSSASLAWYKSSFNIPAFEGWHIPWKLNCEAEGGARIFLNGEHIGCYFTAGPQKQFYLPECYIKAGAENEIAVAVLRDGEGVGLKSLSIEPYAEYSVFTHKLKIGI
jgi:hypothetical protein